MSETLAPPPTAGPYAAPELDQLTAQARRLWDREPAVAHDDREAIVHELIDVDLQLERISLRARWTTLDAGDLAELENCSQRIQSLQCHWMPHP